MSTFTTSRRHDEVTPVRGHIPGEAGAWLFILGDMTVFAVFFATYLYYRGQDRALFITSSRELAQGFGVANTLILLTSSLFVVLGLQAMRSGRVTAAPWLFTGALACGFAFCGMKALEWGRELVTGITPTTNNFFMYYYVLTGLHLFHVVVGMVVLAFVIRASRSAGPLATGLAGDSVRLDRRMIYIEGGACFWHMVDLIWIVLFPLLYLIK